MSVTALSAGVVLDVWRYPVMGMRGETLEKAKVSKEGVEGDHTYVVRDRVSQRVLDPKSLAYAWGETKALPSMLDLKAELHEDQGGDAELRIRLPGGAVYSSMGTDLDRVSSEFLGRQVELVKYPRVAEARVRSGRALHLLTTASLRSIAKFYPAGQFDVKRFRPNLFVKVDGRDEFVEEGWVGKTLRIGENVQLRVEKPNVRCKVTTMKHDNVVEDMRILSAIEGANAKKLGVMCSILRAGIILAGDRVWVS